MKLTILVLSLLFLNLSRQTLIVKTSKQALISIFNGFSSSLKYSLENQPIHGQFQYKLAQGFLEADFEEIANANVDDSYLEFVNGSYYLQIRNLDIHLNGHWRHKNGMHEVTRNGKFQFNFTDLNFTFSEIVPKNYDGLLFVTDPACSGRTGSFSYFIEEPLQYTKDFVAFFRKSVEDGGIGSVFCESITTAIDSFLKERVGRLLLRRGLTTGAVLYNSLFKEPELLSSGHLITYHRGTLKQEADHRSREFRIDNTKTTYAIQYFMSRELVEEVISSFFNTLVRNQSYADDSNTFLQVVTLSGPAVTMKGGFVHLLATQQFVAKDKGTSVLNERENINLKLKPGYRKNFCVDFTMKENADFNVLKGLRSKYEPKLKKNLENFVASIYIPLPSVDDLQISQGSYLTSNVSLSLSVNFASSLN